MSLDELLGQMTQINFDFIVRGGNKEVDDSKIQELANQYVGISEVLFGKENFSGKMALTYPKTSDYLNMATPYYGRRGDMCVESSCPVEWQFCLTPGADQVTVTVTNSGVMKARKRSALYLGPGSAA
ncbi:Aste57867_19154 [Aphanomyces stellatus]|uniref:Aste57867_19154 protein n=1 Tax=Aphanomyces stellatus TaxID=120398 RepID=A0A485LC36_9STRA|nr:hypothetical protein As57867_019090 [Aphanomyces stellatus]VFT95876.1 Aste57867_19154 [Aphanomyces stellatus]